MRLNTLFLALGLAALSTIAVASVPAQRYVVSLKIFDGERLRFSPSLLAESQSAATLRIRDKSESIEVVAFSRKDGQFHVSASLLQWTSDGLIGSDQATVLNGDGKPAAIILNKPDARTGAPGEMRIEVTVRLVPQG